MRKHVLLVLLIGLLPAVISACVSFAETPGERFQKNLKEMADLCQSKKLIATDSRCILPKLKPADPLATEEGRFAHSIKIPNPVPEDSGYKPGMTPEQYFDHLCKTEAGEFIYKTVENVEGLYMMRVREHATDHQQEHLFALEDPYGYTDWEATRLPTVFINPPWASYSYLEIPLDMTEKMKTGGARYRRFSGYVQRKSQMVEENETTLTSRYGFTWRGIQRPHDRELGIAGGELIVFDLQTNEVLGVRRGFVRSGGVRNLTGIWWLAGAVCPKYSDKAFSKDGNFAYWFVSKVLKPSQ